jgi:hypothetical protein
VLFAPVIASPGDGISSYEDTIPNASQKPSQNDETINGVTVQSINPNGNPLTLNRYTPANLRLVYASASSYFLNVSYASTTEHYETQSSNDMSVQISADGSYQFRFNVLYEAPINQTVTLIVTGGDGMSDSYPINCPPCSGFSLDVSISTVNLPHYPTASEIAAAQSDINREIVENVTTRQDNLEYNQTMFNGVIIAIIVIVGVVIVVLLVLLYRRQNHMHVRQVRMEVQPWRLPE